MCHDNTKTKVTKGTVVRGQLPLRCSILPIRALLLQLINDSIRAFVIDYWDAEVMYSPLLFTEAVYMPVIIV